MALARSEWELYNLVRDRGESRNLATEYPEKVQELEKAWNQHAAEFHALAQQDPPAAGKGKNKGKGKKGGKSTGAAAGE